MKKTVLLCDSCGKEVENDGAFLRLNYLDARKGSLIADLCGTCASNTPGRSVARRGRKPKEG